MKLTEEQKNEARVELNMGHLPRLLENQYENEMIDLLISWINYKLNFSYEHDALLTLLSKMALEKLEFLQKIEKKDIELFKKIILLRSHTGATLLAKVMEQNCPEETIIWFIQNGANINFQFAKKLNLLHIAAESNAIKLLKTIKELHNDSFKKMLDDLDSNGFTPLALAVHSNLADCIEWLINNGADIDWHLPTHNDYRLLHLAASINALDSLKKLKELNLNAFNKMLNMSDDTEFTPLAYAVVNKHAESIEWLINNGADINWSLSNHKNHRLIHLATARNALDFLKKLKELNLNAFNKMLNLHDDNDLTPLAYAVLNNHPDIIEWLIEHQADIDCPLRNDKNCTLLHIAVEKGAVDALKKIKMLNPNLFNRAMNIADKDGFTPIALAVAYNHTNCIEWLLNDANIDWSHPSDKSYTLLHLAAKYGAVDALEKIKNLNSNFFNRALNIADRYGHTPLALAVAYNHTNCIEWLLNNRANIDWSHPMDKNYRLIHLAAVKNSLDSLKKLKELNLNAFNKQLNLLDDHGLTPLAYAVQYNHPDSIEWLVEHHADINPTLRNDKNCTLLHIAAENGAVDALEKIKKLNHNLFNEAMNIANKHGYTPLACAVSDNRKEALVWLLQNGAEPNCYKTDGFGLLHFAATNNAITCLIELRNLKPDFFRSFINSADNDGFTPLSYAFIKKHKECVEWICSNLDPATTDSKALTTLLAPINETSTNSRDTSRKDIRNLQQKIKKLSILFQFNLGASLAFKLIARLIEHSLELPSDNNVIGVALNKYLVLMFAGLPDEMINCLHQIVVSENSAPPFNSDTTNHVKMFSDFAEQEGAIAKLKAALISTIMASTPDLPMQAKQQVMEELISAIFKSIKKPQPSASSKTVNAEKSNLFFTLEVFWQGDIKKGTNGFYKLIKVKLDNKLYEIQPPLINTQTPIHLTKNGEPQIFRLNDVRALQELSIKLYWDKPYTHTDLGMMQPDGSVRIEQDIKLLLDEEIKLGKEYQLLIQNQNGVPKAVIADKSKRISLSSEPINAEEKNSASTSFQI